MQTVVPAIRSSDFSYLGDPFRYLLARRYGFTPALRESEALAHGTWFHAAAEQADIEALWLERKAELTEVANTFGITPTGLADLLKLERKYCDEACCWYKEATRYEIPNWGSVDKFLAREHIRVLGREILAVDLERSRAMGVDVPRIAQLDLLLYHEKNHALFVGDWKTSTKTPINRAKTCPIEAQTRHYTDTVHWMLPQIIEKYDLPNDTHVGGMMHFIVQKPTIRMGQGDRPHYTEQKEVTRGKNKGEIRTKKIFTGDEPDPDLYMARVRDWYRAEGEYTHLQAERADDPPINISTTVIPSPDYLNADLGYKMMLDTLQHLATCPVDPLNQHHLFPKNHSYYFGGTDPLQDFYLTGVDNWPKVMLESRIVVKHRDPQPLPEETTL